MTEDSGSESLLEKISKWDTDNVVTLLQKNDLNECCAAIVERRLDGEGLLSLTERDLNSWENDLAPSSYWNLYRFIVELKNDPEQYLCFEESESKSLPLADSDIFSDSDPWDTDFDTDDDASNSNHQRVLKSFDQDCTEEEEDYSPEMQFNNKKNPRALLRPVPKTPGVMKTSPYSKKEEVKTEEEDEEDENVYANGIELNKPIFTHVSATKSKFESGNTQNADLGELLQKELRLRERMNKPIVVPKSSVVQNTAKVNARPASSIGNSFLHSQQSKIEKSKSEQQSTKSNNKVSALKSELFQNLNPVRLKKPDQYLPTPPKSKLSPAGSPVSDKKRDLPKPPATSPLLIGKLDLLADLPRSDKNPESIRRNNNQTSSGSTRSHKKSNGIPYHTQSVSSVDEDEDTNEDEDSIYERINDPTALNVDFLQSRTQRPIVFPSLPVNPPLLSAAVRVGRQLLGGLGSRLADEVADMIVRIKRGLLNCCHTQNSEAPEAPEPPKPPERPVVRKIGNNFSSSGINQSSPFDGRVTRPLPSPPDGKKAERPIDLPIRKTDGQTYKDKPWFHDVSREQAEVLITGGGSDFGSTLQNGYFLVRPSGYALDRPLTLVLRYKNRPFNIPVRARPDSLYALGSLKPDEQTFGSVEEMVDFHKKNELVLYRNGVSVGNTRLTDTPPQRKD